METGAATQPLTAAPRPPVAAPRPAAGGTGTGPLAGGSATAALPKATQKLQGTPGMAPRPSVAAPQSAPVKRAAASDSQQFYEEKDPEAGLVPLSVVCLVLSVVLMAAQLLSTDRTAFTSPKGADSPFMVPERDDPPWVKFNDDHTYTDSFKSVLPPIPQ